MTIKRTNCKVVRCHDLMCVKISEMTKTLLENYTTLQSAMSNLSSTSKFFRFLTSPFTFKPDSEVFHSDLKGNKSFSNHFNTTSEIRVIIGTLVVFNQIDRQFKYLTLHVTSQFICTIALQSSCNFICDFICRQRSHVFPGGFYLPLLGCVGTQGSLAAPPASSSCPPPEYT